MSKTFQDGLTRQVRMKKLREAIFSFDGKQADFAKVVNVEPSFLSQMKTGNKQVPDAVARNIEVALGKPRFWMDIDPSESYEAVMADHAKPAALKSASASLRPVMTCPCCHASFLVDSVE